MKEIQRPSPFPLRLAEDVKEEAKIEAGKNRRSLNAEIGLLIEEGLKWREAQKRQEAAA
ncbi:Arc domain-containing protein [Pseudomonas marincola]|uniref:Arc-like DNA binding domain-containing protein n=1 Tax=Pseudomonas marincola TaxID=437900 RepID=A0A653E6T0_9PSED|nr:Arc family DNA-binding protein [Pseudomonas marincola]CAE6906833.1 Arc domain-containing protein [Pseudomonas marincola]